MQSRCPFVRQFQVNGNKCEVSIDSDCITWTLIKGGSNNNNGNSNSSVSIDLSVDGQSNGNSYIINSTSSSNSGGKGKRGRHDNGTKRVEFDQVIGIRRWPLPKQEAAQPQQQQQSSLSPSTLSQSCKLHKTLSIDSAKRHRIKLYYAKQSSNKLSVTFAQFNLIQAHQQQQCRNYQSLGTRTPTHTLDTATVTITSTTTIANEQPRTPLDELAQMIEEVLEVKRLTRPQRLLIFVNPYGGKGKALRLYKSQVRRLLELAGIETKLVVTNYQNHARDTIEDPLFNVEYFDGVVCVGGDGMFAELMNGLLFRYNRYKISEAQISQLATSCKQAHQQQGQQAGSEPSVIPCVVGGGKRDSSNGTSNGGGSSSGHSGFAVGGGISGGELSENDDLDQQLHNGSAEATTTTTAQVTTSGTSDDDDKPHRRHDHHKPPVTTNTTTTDSAIDGDEVSERAGVVSANDNILLMTENKNNQDVSFSENYTLSEQRLIEFRSALGGIGQQFDSPPIPIGVIGAGSTDANSFGFIGTNDVITATLNIILGNQIKIDVCSVHTIRDDRVLRFVSTFVAYGYFGDVIRESEKLRWLGPSRYDVTGVNNLIKNRAYKGKVEILTSSQDGTPNNNLERCHSKCEQCSVNGNDILTIKRQTTTKHKESEFRFIEIQGSFIGVNAAVTACRCHKTKKGFSPSNHLANGCADLILVRPCTRMQYLHYLLRTGWTKKSAFDLKYVEAYRCRQFEFVALNPSANTNSISSNSITTTNSTTSNKTSSSLPTTATGIGSNTSDSSLGLSSWTSLSDSSAERGSTSNSLDSHQSDKLKGSIGSTFSSWNVDGEILNEQSIRVKVNNKLMRVFGTGEPNSTN